MGIKQQDIYTSKLCGLYLEAAALKKDISEKKSETADCLLLFFDHYAVPEINKAIKLYRDMLIKEKGWAKRQAVKEICNQWVLYHYGEAAKPTWAINKADKLIPPLGHFECPENATDLTAKQKPKEGKS